MSRAIANDRCETPIPSYNEGLHLSTTVGKQLTYISVVGCNMERTEARFPAGSLYGDVHCPQLDQNTAVASTSRQVNAREPKLKWNIRLCE